MAEQNKIWTDQRVELVVGNLLRAGVLLAASIILAGGIIYLVRHGRESAEYSVFQGEPKDLCSPTGIVKNALAFKGRGLIQFGLLVLIATPVFRVIFSAYAFYRQKDWTYVFITLTVLTILLFSFLSGEAG